MQQRLAVSVVEAAEMLSIAPRTLRAWLLTGKVRCVRLGRRVVVPIAELERLVSLPQHQKHDSPPCEGGPIEQLEKPTK